MTVLNGQYEAAAVAASGVQILNPFVHKLELDNPIDKIKTAVLTVLLLPLRVICICFLLITAWFLACIGLCGISVNDLRTKPLTGWRRKWRYLTSFIMRAILFAGSFQYIKITGKHASPKQAPILAVAPHSSFFDSIVAIIVGPPSPVSKAEIAMLPFFGNSIVDDKNNTLIANGEAIMMLSIMSLKYVISKIGLWSYLAGGMAITVKGQQASRSEAAVLVLAPHSTFLDSVIVYVTNMCSVIVRKESMDNYAGKIIDYTQPIYVWRDDPNSRQNTIKSIIERAHSKEDWPQIVIFPEGTCTNRSCLITFKPGAFYPGVPVQPVCIRYPNKLDTVTWTWEGPGVLKLLWLTLTQVHSSCEIEFLPVYVPNEEEKANPKLYARNVRNVMAKALGVPVSDYTYDDCKLITRARQMNILHSADIVEVKNLRSKIGLEKTNIEEQIVKSSLVNNVNCYLTLSEFSLRLQISAQNTATIQLFNLFDKNQNGTIDFREYLLCALFIMKTDVPLIQMLHLVSMMYENKEMPDKLTSEVLYTVTRSTLALTREETDAIFHQIDIRNRRYITFNEFRKYLESRPEFAYVFQSNQLMEKCKPKQQ